MLPTLMPKLTIEQRREGLRGLIAMGRWEQAAQMVASTPGLSVSEQDFPALRARSEHRATIAAKRPGWGAAEGSLKLLESIGASSIETQEQGLTYLAQYANAAPKASAPTPAPTDPGIEARCSFDAHVRRGEYDAAAAVAIEAGLSISLEHLPTMKGEQSAAEGPGGHHAVAYYRVKHRAELAAERGLLDSITDARKARALSAVETPTLARLEELERTSPPEATLFAAFKRAELATERAVRQQALEAGGVA